MKKSVFILSFLFAMNIYLNAQSLSEAPNFDKYAKANSELASPQQGEKRVVFIGNSITEGWVNMRPDFFTANNYIGRGIGGQTSPQLLLRFRQDVVDLQPTAVIINIGTNDIAENTGKYNPVYTFDNIKSMAEIAKANGIKVILSSVLPVGEYPWRTEIKNVPQTIDALNANIKAYAEANGFDYIDYNIEMRDANGAMIEGYGSDGVHPTIRGYEVMEVIAKKVIDKVIE
ncbi:SGNH/GDSL hydrolase family protein [Dysgonomonas sp. ZJ279]|uniref:SGNH/GDSL hydrolase family protein n=1 Tax=Dysgonomonas sp. ZJ279 TaxID=2709796 RepID=UPI0013ED7492|nr:SGNH/GDSL hydrolase family protein [Dysgonomonas sp. ZJ279]